MYNVIIRKTTNINPQDQRTKCGHFPNFGGTRRPGSTWYKVQNQIWPAVFNVGDTMTLSEFQNRMYGLYRAAGFDRNYAKKLVTLYHLNNGIFHSGAAELV